MRVKISLAIIFLTVALLVSGCWGSRETDEMAYILSMGFDKGEKNNLVVTFTVANPKAVAGQTGGGGGGGGGDQIAFTGSVEAMAPVAAFDLMNTATTRWLSLQHTKDFIFSEELARDGLGDWLTTLNRYRQIRETANVFIVRGSARDFLEKNQPLLEVTPSKQYELIAKLPEVNSFFLPRQFHEFYEDAKTLAIQPTLPLAAIHKGALGTAKPGPLQGGTYAVGPYKAGEVPIAGKNVGQFIGTAVFRADKMVGELTGEETRYYLLLRGQFKNGIIGFPDPIAGYEKFIGLNMRQGRKPEVRTQILADGKVVIDVDIYLEPEMVSVTSGISYEEPDKKSILEQAVIQYFERNCNDLIRRCQEEFKSDILGFGNVVKHHFWTVSQWEEFGWQDKFPEAQINVKVHAKIRRTGLQLKTNPIKGGT